MNEIMKQIEYTKTEIHELKGYIFDGTIECAKNIFKEIQTINNEWVKGFNLKIDLFNDTIDFNYGGYSINEGDLVAIRDDDKMRMSYQTIEIITPKELNRWGFKVK